MRISLARWSKGALSSRHGQRRCHKGGGCKGRVGPAAESEGTREKGTGKAEAVSKEGQEGRTHRSASSKRACAVARERAERAPGDQSRHDKEVRGQGPKAGQTPAKANGCRGKEGKRPLRKSEKGG